MAQIKRSNSCIYFMTSLLVLMVIIDTRVSAQTIESHCNYLLGLQGTGNYIPNAPSMSPFKIYTRSRAPEIKAGEPVQVTIGPFSHALNFFNFTDFILYAIPNNMAAYELEYFGASGVTPHVGVFQLFDGYRAGSGAMSCNPRSGADDSVGAFEDRLLDIFKRYYPNNPMLMRYQPPARNQVSVLWWPTQEALSYPEIIFVANIKSMGNWFKLQSTPWKVNRPVDQWAMTERMLTQYQALQSNMRAMERRLDQPV